MWEPQADEPMNIEGLPTELLAIIFSMMLGPANNVITSLDDLKRLQLMTHLMLVSKAFKGAAECATPASSLTSISDRAFHGCTGLSSITLPAGVTSIGDDAFQGCTSLTSITLPEGVTSIGDCAFFGCTGLSSITLSYCQI